MGFFAPRISNRLRDEIDRLASKPYRAAEVCRAIGKTAEEQGVRRPSYEQVRTLVHQLRALKRDPSIGQVLLDIDLRRRPPEAIVDALVGTAPRLLK